MHLSRRLMLSLLGGVAVVSMVFALYQASAEMHAMRDEVAAPGDGVGREPAEARPNRCFKTARPPNCRPWSTSFRTTSTWPAWRSTVPQGQPLAMTPGLATGLTKLPTPPVGSARIAGGGCPRRFLPRTSERMHILALPLRADGRRLGAIAIFHNVGFIAAPVWRHALTSVAQTLLIVGMTLLIIRWSLGKPLRHMAQWLRDLRTGDASPAGQPPKEEIFGPLDQRSDAAGHQPARGARRRRRGSPSAGCRLRPTGPPSGCASRCRAN